MAITEAHRAQLTIPAEYLDDARAAIAAEIAEESGCLRSASENVDDWGMAARILSKDMLVLEQLQHETADTELTALHDGTSAPLIRLLEEMVDLWAGRLRDVVQYGPMPMGDVLDLATRLRWAAEEAIRIEPTAAHRLNAVELGREAA